MPSAKKTRRYVTLVLASLLFGGAAATAQTNKTEKDLRVLFIGNSLTYSNQLPEMAAALARSSKRRKLSFKTVAYPNYALEDHWNEKEVHKLLDNNRWDYVVMQQGPSASDDGRRSLIEYVKKFSAKIKNAGARPVLFGVWAPRSYESRMFDRTIGSYELAAKEVDGVYAPAGRAWLLALQRDPHLKLYGPDGFHPTEAGTYLAALVVFRSLYSSAAVGVQSDLRLAPGSKFGLTDAQVKVLQLAAAEAIKEIEK